jgi:hypothetical protein
VAALDRVIASRLGTALPRRTLVRLQRASGGNPLFALGIGSALIERGDPPEQAGDLPIPTSLQELVCDRLALLPPPAREVAQIAAALSRPTAALVDAAMGGRGAGAAVEAAVQTAVVELDGEQIRFTHPLVADDVALRIEIEEGLAWCLHSTRGLAAAEAHARTALELAEFGALYRDAVDRGDEHALPFILIRSRAELAVRLPAERSARGQEVGSRPAERRVPR